MLMNFSPILILVFLGSALSFSQTSREPKRPSTVAAPATSHCGRRSILCASGVTSNDVAADAVESSSIPGLMSEKDFAYRSAAHNTLNNLRHQLPRTLTVPIKADEAKQTYAKDCALIGPKGEVLGSDREEIMSVSQAIATTIGTARRAGQFLAAATSGTGENAGDQGLNMDLVDCELTLDSSLSVLHVKWTTTLPVSVTGALPDTSGTRRRSRREDREDGNRSTRSSRSSSSSSPPHSKIIGSSVFTFNAAGLISKHRILHVEIDGRSVDAIGPRLASLRETVRSVTERSPWVLEAAEAAAPLLTNLAELANAANGGRLRQNGQEQRESEVSSKKKQKGENPVLVADIPSSQQNNASIWKTSSSWKVDDVAPQNMTNSFDYQYPLPGGKEWKSYELAHDYLLSFVKTTVPYLAAEIDPAIFPIPNGKSFRDFFASDVELKAFDGTTLVSGSGRVADLYRAASGLRQNAGLSSDPEDAWRITDISVDWRNLTATVRWLSTVQIRVEGTDTFYLDQNGEITEIVQKKLTVGGNKIIDAVWIQSIISAVESSRGGAGGEILGDVLKRISRGRAGSRSTGQVDLALKKNDQQVPPDLDDTAAAAIYNIMRTLHAELPSLVDATAPALTPAKQFLSEEVELRGLLDETLARGTKAYAQALTTSIGSLRTALRTGSVRSVKDVVPRIELLKDGSIQVDVKLAFRIEAPSLLPSLSPRQRGPNNDEQGQSSLGFPLELDLISVYKFDRRGKIVEHRIVENKINGRKSPADVVSNWIKGGGEISSPERAVQSFVDAVKWARKLSGNVEK